MEKNKKILKTLKGAEACIIATDKGVGVVGGESEVLTCFTMLIKALAESIDKETLDKVYELAFKSDKELAEMALEKLKELLNKMGE